MLQSVSEPVLAALFGGIGGVLLGLAARLGRFCTMGAIEDALYGGSTHRLRMWGVAIGVAIVGTYVLIGRGLLNPATTIYLGQGWNPLAAVIGGGMFGYGMALAGNCGYGALARLGGGDMRSFVIVLVMGLSAYVTLAGPLAPLRAAYLGQGPTPATTGGFAFDIATFLGVSAPAVGIAIGLLVLLGTFSSASFRKDRVMIFWGAIAGIAVVSGWAATAWLARTGFEALPVVSHSFSAPVGETLLYAMTSTGNSLSFGIGSVVGVLVGAFIGSLFKGHFRWEACEDPRELRRQITGAVLMGIGAVVALGCSIGQGLSGMSTLAYSAPIVLAAIFAGAALGLRQLIEGRLFT